MTISRNLGEFNTKKMPQKSMFLGRFLQISPCSKQGSLVVRGWSLGALSEFRFADIVLSGDLSPSSSSLGDSTGYWYRGLACELLSRSNGIIFKE